MVKFRKRNLMKRNSKWMVAGILVAVMAVAGLLVMEQVWIRQGKREHHEAAVWLREEVRRVGTDAFVEKSRPEYGLPGERVVAFREVEGLSPEVKEALLECEVFVGNGTTQGIFFNLAGGPGLYVSLDGSGVPGYYAGYQKERVLEDVYRIYRTHD